MPKHKASHRKLMDVDDLTVNPPTSLTEYQSIVRVVKANGNNLYLVKSCNQEDLLVELASKFRSSVWLRRNGFVLIDKESSATRDNKIQGEIINVCRSERDWRKMDYWPQEFDKEISMTEQDGDLSSEEEDDVRGKMPPLDESD